MKLKFLYITEKAENWFFFFPEATLFSFFVKAENRFFFIMIIFKKLSKYMKIDFFSSEKCDFLLKITNKHTYN